MDEQEQPSAGARTASGDPDTPSADPQPASDSAPSAGRRRPRPYPTGSPATAEPAAAEPAAAEPAAAQSAAAEPAAAEPAANDEAKQLAERLAATERRVDELAGRLAATAAAAERTDESADQRTAQPTDRGTDGATDGATDQAAAPDGAAADRPARRRLPGARYLRRLVKLVVVLAVLAVVVVLLRAYVVTTYRVTSASMEPTLHGCATCNDDHVLVQKIGAGDPGRGDIVVFNRPRSWKVHDSTIVERVIGLPGDRLSVRRGHLFVNGQRLLEPYVNHKCPTVSPLGRRSVVKVPRDRYFVMGDDRCHSLDSRRFGAVPGDDIVGRVLFVVWPLGDVGSP